MSEANDRFLATALAEDGMPISAGLPLGAPRPKPGDATTAPQVPPERSLVSSLVGETVEVARDYSHVAGGTRGVIRAAYLSANDEGVEAGGPSSVVYCLVQLPTGALVNLAATHLRVITGLGMGSVDVDEV